MGSPIEKRGMPSHNSYNKNGFIPNHKKGNVSPHLINTLFSSSSSCEVLTKIFKASKLLY